MSLNKKGDKLIFIFKANFKLTYLLFYLAVVFFIVVGSRLGICQDHGDAIVSGSIADARTLIPILASDTASSSITGLLFNALLKYDKDLNLIGDLAERWEIKEDGLVIIFYLRKDVFWHDGHPFTAEDIEFTYQKLIDPNVPTPYSGDFERIKSFEILDNYAIKITYKEPFAPALSSWGMPILPKHILEKEDLSNTKFSRNPIGLGPYKFKTWKTQEKIELRANHKYYQKRPYIDRTISRVIPDESTIFLELQTQGLDSSGLSPLQYWRQTNTLFFKRYYNKFRLPSFSYVYMGYNLNDPRFKDKRIRQALNLAVDKQEIINIVLLGLARVCSGPFVPESWAYNEKVVPAPFAPLKAKEILAEAGWQDTNGDSWLDKQGEIFEFTIITNQGNEERIKTAQIIQKRLKEIGIRVKIKVVEWSVFLSQFIDKRAFEAVILGWSLAREPDNYDIWHSSRTKAGEFNFLGYNNPQVDNVLVEARRTFEQEKRKVYYHCIHEILYEEQPCMFLYVPDSLLILHRRFRNVKPEAAGISYNFIDWWVPRLEQKYRITP